MEGKAAAIPLPDNPTGPQIALTPSGRIEYTCMGSGPAVMVLHGTSSDCHTAMDPAPLLSAGYRLLTPSRPGYGRTPLSIGQTIADTVRALTALLDILHIETCALVAVSGGGPTAIALAVACPQRIRSLALISAVTDTALRAADPGLADQRSFYGPLHPVLWVGLRLSSRVFTRQMARKTLEIFSTHDPDDALHRLTAADIGEVCRFYRRASSRIGALNDLTHELDAGALRKVQCPTLIIHSREDRAVPFHHAEIAHRQIPRATLLEYGFTGHFYWIGPEYPALLRQLISHLAV